MTRQKKSYSVWFYIPPEISIEAFHTFLFFVLLDVLGMEFISCK